RSATRIKVGEGRTFGSQLQGIALCDDVFRCPLARYWAIGNRSHFGLVLNLIHLIRNSRIRIRLLNDDGQKPLEQGHPNNLLLFVANVVTGDETHGQKHTTQRCNDLSAHHCSVSSSIVSTSSRSIPSFFAFWNILLTICSVLEPLSSRFSKIDFASVSATNA